MRSRLTERIGANYKISGYIDNAMKALLTVRERRSAP
jgi:hypothetical protein